MTTLLSSFLSGLTPEALVVAYDKVLGFIQEYYGEGYWFLILSLLSMLYLSLEIPSLRRSLFLPVLLILGIIIQPFLYAKIFYRIIYWRLFWMLPDAFLIALALTMMTKRFSRLWLKLIFLAIVCAGIAWIGKSSFADGRYVIAENPYKIKQNVIDICDIMLAIDDHPHVISLDAQFCEARQYNGNIIQAFGRDAVGYITESTQRQKDEFFYLHNQEGANFDLLLPLAIEDGFDFIISYISRPISPELQKEYGYYEIAVVGYYVIYYSEDVHQSRLE